MRSPKFATCLTLLVTGILIEAISNSPAQALPINLKIHVDRVNGRMWFTPPVFAGVCGPAKQAQDNNNPSAGRFCKGDEISWTLVGGLDPDEILTIVNAPGHAPCFAPNIPEMFDNSGGTSTMPVNLSSGPPGSPCDWSPFGLYWSYVVTLIRPSDPPIVSDPGAVIFP